MAKVGPGLVVQRRGLEIARVECRPLPYSGEKRDNEKVSRFIHSSRVKLRAVP